MRDERVDRIDRAVLYVLGAIAALAGIGVLLHATGALGRRRSDSPVLASPTTRWYADHATWVWPLVAVLLAIVAALSVWWVSSQVRLQGSSRVDLARDGAGSLNVSGTHLAECVERDAVNQDGIDHARARVSATAEAVDVWLTLWVGPPYDVGRSVSRVANTVLPNLATALDGVGSRPIRTHINVETAEAAVSRLD
ncbi:Asp23/Gls24 family envelope stress response protein [Cumulibacter manganitolerans]|uniref:hypothetical protein n=1 Tax=Cumulibacter manganitolerans TaxID=1884992 RepID=UPI001295B03D|nr:hypothetical protein [Cumulibacter manganitolerans]